MSNFVPFLQRALCCLLLVVFLYSCNSRGNAPDVSKINVNLQTNRLDMELAKLDTNNLSAGLEQLNRKYPDFLNFYLDTLMAFGIHGNYNDSNGGIRQGLKVFLTHKDYRGLFDTVAKHYPDTKDVDGALSKGFQYVQYYFPHYKVPKVYYVVSGLNNWGAFTYGSDIVGVGLDMFLGDNYPFYQSVGLPDYMYKELRPTYIPVAVFSAVYEDTSPFESDGRNLLDMMLQKGKEQYFLHKVLPNMPDSVLFGFSGAQTEWSNNHEAVAYNFFVQQQLFYDKDLQKVMRYVKEAPNTAGIAEECPGNIGTWVGYNIVCSYMKEHPETTLPALAALKTDPQSFLIASKYKPK